MLITEHKVNDADATAHNDDSDLHNDEIGENTGEDTGLAAAIRNAKTKPDNDGNKSPKKENL